MGAHLPPAWTPSVAPAPAQSLIHHRPTGRGKGAADARDEDASREAREASYWTTMWAHLRDDPGSHCAIPVPPMMRACLREFLSSASRGGAPPPGETQSAD